MDFDLSGLLGHFLLVSFTFSRLIGDINDLSRLRSTQLLASHFSPEELIVRAEGRRTLIVLNDVGSDSFVIVLLSPLFLHHAGLVQDIQSHEVGRIGLRADWDGLLERLKFYFPLHE